MDTAGAQTNSNLQTAIGQSYLNQNNQVTPWGSTTSGVSGFNTINGPDGKPYQIPQFTQTTTLNPRQQKALDATNQTQLHLAKLASNRAGAVGKMLNQPMFDPNYKQFKGGPKLQTQIADAGQIQKSLGGQDTWGRVQDVESAMFQRYNPQLEQDRQRMEQQLANQGIRMGSTAWNTAMDQQARNVNDARLGITINAGQEQNRLQQLDLNSGNFANAAQQQQYGQNANNAQFYNTANQQMFTNNMAVTAANNGLQDSQFANNLARRNQVLNEQSALMSGSQIAPPQFQQGQNTQVGGTDIAGLLNNQYNQQMQQNNSMWGGIGQAGAAIAPWLLSDERTKENKQKIGTMGKGIDLYAYNYIGDPTPRFGPMAQDVERKIPDAVATGDDGYKRINVPKLTMALGVK